MQHDDENIAGEGRAASGCYARLPPENIAMLELLDKWEKEPAPPTRATRFKFKWFASSVRWKGELYLFPAIRFSWGREFEFSARNYWVGIYWLQWSIHFGWNEVSA